MINLNCRFFWMQAIWFILYYAAAYASFFLDEPIGDWGLIWLPAGLVVSAYLTASYKQWPILTITFLVSHAIIDVQAGRSLLISMPVAFVTISSGVAIASITKTSSRYSNYLGIVLRWMTITLVISAIGSLLGTAWLAYFDNIPFRNTAWIWWRAHVTGILLLTPIIMGFYSSNVNDKIYGTRTQIIGIVYFLLLCTCTWYLFKADRKDFIEIQSLGGATALVAMIGTPIGLMVRISVVGNRRLNSLALSCLGTIVIYYTMLERGPFAFGVLHNGESLILVQCFLVANSSLVVLLRASNNPRKWKTLSDDSYENLFYYRIRTQTGEVDWDKPIYGTLDVEVSLLDTVSGILNHVHPEDRETLVRRLLDMNSKDFQENIFTFRLITKSGQCVQIFDKRSAIIDCASATVLMGYWKLHTLQ